MKRLVGWLRGVGPARCLDAFVAMNLAFLALDVYIAHLTNRFEKRIEWAPIAVGGVGALLLAPSVALAWLRSYTRFIDCGVAVSSIAVGVAGLVLHLNSAFFERETIRDLVYTAPFVAPLSFVGVGLLVALSRIEKRDSYEFGAWVVFLAMGGFLGNTVLSLLDHAENGFFSRVEWVPVIAAAFATAFLLIAVLYPERAFLRVSVGVLAIQIPVGIAGCVFHVIANQRRPDETLLQRTVHGAPVFAPLLFANLALLAAIGIWAMIRAGLPCAAGMESAARVSDGRAP
jgi:hypothetical protein